MAIAARATQSTFGPYLLQKRIGSNSLTEVYEAVQEGGSPENPVMIRRLHAHLRNDARLKRRFLDNANLMKEFRHRNVLTAIDSGEIDGYAYVATDGLGGRDLLEVMRQCALQRRRPAIAISLHCIAECLAGLGHVHGVLAEIRGGTGAIHGEIAPSNIRIADDGRVVLGGIGIMPFDIEDESASLLLQGRYGYLAPEVANGDLFDQRADVFAMAVVLAELLLMRRLFEGKSDLDVLMKVRAGRMDRLEQFGEKIPDQLKDVMKNALMVSPEERCATASEFEQHLRAYACSHHRLVTQDDIAEFMRRLVSGGAISGKLTESRGVLRSGTDS